MGGAAALHNAIELASLTGLALLRAQNGGAVRPLEVLLSAAPTIGWLFCLTLSRVRELDADAAALELTGDPLIARGGAQQAGTSPNRLSGPPDRCIRGWSDVLSAQPSSNLGTC